MGHSVVNIDGLEFLGHSAVNIDGLECLLKLECCFVWGFDIGVDIAVV